MTQKKHRIVLVINDAEMVRRIATVMNQKNFELVTCEEPEGVRALLTAAPISILIFDLARGIGLARHIMTNYPETILVGLDTTGDQEAIQKAQKVGVSVILESLELKNLSNLTPNGPVQHFERVEEFLGNHEIKALLQPIVFLSNPKEILGLESLARPPKHLSLWNPETLFNYAARKEHLFETDMLCLKAAFQEAKKVKQLDKLFINLRPRSMTHPNFIKHLLKLVEAEKIDISCLVFELTEQQSILNLKTFIANLKTLREQGIQFALDDFGTGFANLEWLYELKPDYLKIAGMFCRNLHQDLTKQVLVQATTQIAQKLGIQTVLENIETRQELQIAIELGVNYGQGYFFRKPSPASKL